MWQLIAKIREENSLQKQFKSCSQLSESLSVEKETYFKDFS